jgi:channel protein (hemolysin III family)
MLLLIGPAASASERMLPGAMDSRPAPFAELYHLPGFHEPFSAISHLLGALLFLVLGGLLLRRGRGSAARLIFLGVYAASCVFLFAMSGVYHQMVRGGTAHAVLGRLDHSAIFILIAGTFTPAHGILFRGPLRWGPLLLIWTAAAAGLTLKTIFYNDVSEWLGLSFYLTLGWFGGVSGFLLARRFGLAFIQPLLIGGLAYTVGGVMEFLGWLVVIPGVVHPHELFHVAVLVGAFFHWLFVWQFADGRVRGREAVPPSPRPRQQADAARDLGKDQHRGGAGRDRQPVDQAQRGHLEDRAAEAHD